MTVGKRAFLLLSVLALVDGPLVAVVLFIRSPWLMAALIAFIAVNTLVVWLGWRVGRAREHSIEVFADLSRSPEESEGSLMIDNHLLSQTQRWLRGYLAIPINGMVLRESVLAQGERIGFSERKVLRAARGLGIEVDADAWTLPAALAPARPTVTAVPAPAGEAGTGPNLGEVENAVIAEITAAPLNVRATTVA